MLDLDFKPSFTRPVKCSIPSGKSTVTQEFSATFEALDIPEFTAFDFDTAEGAKAFLERVLLSADEVTSNGRPVEYTLELRDRLLAKSWPRARRCRR